MKILMFSKLEGVNGVFSPAQCEEGSAKNNVARRLQREEINAAVRGAFAGGATRAVIQGLEARTAAVGFEALDERAETIVGNVPVNTWREEIRGAGFDAVFLLGFHARAHTPEAFFPSTLRPSSIYRMTVNGHEAGEVEETAIRCGVLGLPVVMVTGDDKTCAEARECLGEQPECVVVKNGNAWMPAIKRARQMIEQGAEAAMKRVGRACPYVPDYPLTVHAEYTSTAFLDRYKGPGRKLNPTTLELKYETADDMWSTCRGFMNGWLLPA